LAIPERINPSHYSRREFLKLGLGTVAIITAPEAVLEARRLAIIYDRGKRQPKQIDTIPSQSIIYGTSVNQNETENALLLSRELQFQPQIVNFFLKGYQDRFVFEQVQKALDHGFLPMISWGQAEIFTNFIDTQKNLDLLCQSINNLTGPILFRPYYEINSDWAKSWWGDISPPSFVDGWERLHDYFDTKKVAASFVFCVNTTTVGKPFELYIPRSFKIAAIDGYNKNSIYRTNVRHYMFPNLPPHIEFGPDILTFQQEAPGIPLLVTEVNASIERGRAQWLQEGFRFFAQCGVRGAMTFDWDKEGVAYDEINWSVGSDRSVVKAFHEEFQLPRYASHNPNVETTLKILFQSNTLAA
jgi:hypothetical protein